MKDSRRTLLVVDGDSEPLKELAARFSPERFRLATCPVWEVALEYIAENRPDFVLTDAQAFYVEGMGLLEKIRQVAPETRVLFLDSEGPWSLFMEPRGGDGAEVLINPCSRAELLKAALEAVDTQPPKRRSAEETWV